MPGVLSQMPPALVDMIEQGVSIHVASCDERLRASVMRALGSSLDRAAGRITVFVARSQAAQVLRDIEGGGRIAVMFSRPSTHLTLQVKSTRVAVREAQEGDRSLLERYAQAMEREIGSIGYPTRLARGMLAHRLEDVAALTFEPEEAFDQTPGANAGAPLKGGGMTRLADIRACLEGAVPAAMATCAPDGTPNVVYISQVFYVDERHVALSFQFFNKTRRNVLANPHATVLLLDPRTAAFWRLHLNYLRTESEGPLFEGMRAQLAGIASHTGMEGVFRLLGSDIYEVERIEAVPGEPLPAPPAREGLLAAVRSCAARLARCSAMDEALNAVMETLTRDLAIEHAMVLMLDELAQRLYTVASTGYARSGVGSEIRVGEGVIGVAARERAPVRIFHVTNASTYNQALRSAAGLDGAMEIPYPGLAQPHSQCAVPILSAGRVLGVLFVESEKDLRFGYEDEDVLVSIAAHLGAVIDVMREAEEHVTAVRGEAVPAGRTPASRAKPLAVRHFAANNSVFVGDDYLIKGVAGAILWKLLNEHARGRTEFSNRELRLDPAIGLPDVGDNLEARLVLLRRRLEEYGPDLRIEKTGRGRFRLAVARPVSLASSA